MENRTRVRILGTCSGTEPMPGRRHTSVALRHGGNLYWFDSGESCAYGAYLGGLDLTTTRAIFISHRHLDHVGGLPHLLWTMRKITGLSEENRRNLAGRKIKILVPEPEVFEGVRTMLGWPWDGKDPVFSVEAAAFSDGVIYRENDFLVRAAHNSHLAGGPPFRSFSFRVEAGSKSVVYSGDLRHVSEIDDLVEGCDLFLMETGHHEAEAVCRHLRDRGIGFGRLVFIHHGRAVLRDPAGELARARAVLGDRIAVAEDGLEIEI